MNGLLALSLLGSTFTLTEDWSDSAALKSGVHDVECTAVLHAGAVWGSDVYTGDSDVCTAAVHAGLLRQGEGGTVRIAWGPARRSFAGTERNGVVTSSWDDFPSSFHFPATGRAPKADNPPPPSSLQAWRGQIGELVEMRCEAGDLLRGSVWGTGIYTDDSSPCRAALHAGVIGKKGGEVVAEIAPGRDSYSGSTRHGVPTGSWNQFPGSFTFPDAPPESFPPSGRDLLRDYGLLDKTRTFTEDAVAWEVTIVSDGLILATARARGRVTARLVGAWADSDGAVEVRARLYMTSDDTVTEYPNVVGRITLTKDAKGVRLVSDGTLGFETLLLPLTSRP